MAERDDKSLEQIQKELQLLKRQQKAMQARDDLMTFIKFTSPDPEDPNDVDRSLYKNARHHDAVCAAVEKVEDGTYPFLILTMPPRHGKLCDDDTPVLTPQGFVRHGDIKPGDSVYGPDGQPTLVVAVSEPGVADTEVEFTNGQRVVVHENHEWTVYDRRTQPAKIKTVETRQIAEDFWIGSRGVRGGRARWQLPDVGGVAYPTALLPLHPYTLGVWLGDGSASKPQITGVDEEVFTAVAGASGFSETGRWIHKDTGVTTVSFAGPRPNVRGQLSQALHRLELLNDKHIPPVYQRADRGQRLQLLAGLMDTDGHVEAKTGRCRIVTGCLKLANDIFDLCAGLGFRPYLTFQEPSVSTSGIEGRCRVYTVGFQPYETIPVRLERKRVTRFAMRRRVSIRNVRKVSPRPGRCIQVAREDGLYLVSRGLIPTHNSEIVSRRLPAWLLGRHPDHSVIVATYNDNFAADFGAEARKIIQSNAFKQVFPDCRLTRGGTAKDRLQTTIGGMGVFVGRGGSLTGRGAQVLIIDDLIKDAVEAGSQTIRDQAWEWFTKVAMTRRMGNKSVIMTFTRWHSDDPIGRLTDPENEHYNPRLAERIKIINLPAIAEDDDPMGRARGEPLWPDWYGLDFLEEQRELDPLGFEALYQQRPSLLDGDLFKRESVQYYEPGQLPEDLRIYCASDHAVSTDQRADPTVLLTVGVDSSNRIFLLDCWWQKQPANVVTEAMLDIVRLHRPLQWWAEKGHISKSIGPFLRKRMAETGTFGNIVEVTPSADKVTRAQSIAARFAMGYVYFPRSAWWTEKAINEMMAFPNGLHDDFVDALAYIGMGLQWQVGADKPRASNGNFKPGTFGWFKEQERRARATAKPAFGGF